MSASIASTLLVLLLAGDPGARASAAAPKALTEPLIDVTQIVQDLVLDMRYATRDNFLKTKVYPAARCLLRQSVAERLARVQAELKAKGYRLRVFDCYRPYSVQVKMWKIFPHRGYVADPRTGSNHNRGAAVDIGLTTLDGRLVEMPTEFDTFDRRSRANAEKGISQGALEHRRILREAMEAQGFKVNPMEWWHFDAPGRGHYPIEDAPL